MEQCSPLGWIYYPEEEEMGELKRFLVQTTMELEATILGAHEEISRRDEELTRMRDLLTVAVRERDEAHHKCHELLVDNTCLHQQLQQHKPAALVAQDTKSNSASLASSDSDESELATPSSSTLSSSLPPNLGNRLSLNSGGAKATAGERQAPAGGDGGGAAAPDAAAGGATAAVAAPPAPPGPDRDSSGTSKAARCLQASKAALNVFASLT